MADTKESIVLLGDRLIRKKGYNAFSYADIAKELGVKNAAVHYHFPNKTDLGLAIIDYHLESLENFKKQTQELGSFQKINAFLGIYDHIKFDNKVCLVGAMATDWDTVEEVIQSKMKVFADEILKWLRLVLQEGLDQKIFTFSSSVETKALMIVTNMLAATQLARITGGTNFETVRGEVLKGLKA